MRRTGNRRVEGRSRSTTASAKSTPCNATGREPGAGAGDGSANDGAGAGEKRVGGETRGATPATDGAATAGVRGEARRKKEAEREARARRCAADGLTGEPVEPPAACRHASAMERQVDPSGATLPK